MTTPETARLDRLASALAAAGYRCAKRYRHDPALLQVRHPELPVLGESIMAEPAPGEVGERVWWFRTSTGIWLAPCGDLPGTLLEIARLMAPLVAAARRIDRSRPPHRY